MQPRARAASPSGSDSAPEGRATLAQRFRVCVRTPLWARGVERIGRTPAPQGRTTLAQDGRVCLRTRFPVDRWDERIGNPAPEGRTTLAQRFSAGKTGSLDSSPGGTTQFTLRTFDETSSGSIEK